MEGSPDTSSSAIRHRGDAQTEAETEINELEVLDAEPESPQKLEN
jgi:hypothetical protein